MTVMGNDTEISSLSDEMLMEEFKKGSAAAFDELYRRHSDLVYGYLYNRLGDRALADDIFQATFTKLLLSRQQYDSSLPLLPWLLAVCRSSMIDILRKNRRHTDKLAQVKLNNDTSTEQAQAAEGVLSPKLIESLESLPAKQRAALELRFHDDLSFDAIALKLRTSPANARQLISRAIRFLKRQTTKRGR